MWWLGAPGWRSPTHGEGWLGQVGAWQQCFILEIPSEHWCQVALGSPACPARGGLPSPCSTCPWFCLPALDKGLPPVPWGQAKFLLCFLPDASCGVASTCHPRGTHWPEHLQHGSVFLSVCAPSLRAGAWLPPAAGKELGLQGEWRSCMSEGFCAAGSGPAWSGGWHRGQQAHRQSPARAPQHPAATGARCKAPSWRAALFSSGDTGTRTCSPSQRLPLLSGTTTTSQPARLG